MNVNPMFPLREEEVYELAGCMLTSSTIERYVRCLENSRAIRRLRDELQTVQLEGTDLVAYAWLYRAYVIESKARSEMEIPLAAILYLIGRSGVANVEKLLLAMLVPNRPQMAWLAGLVRVILGRRSSSLVVGSAAVWARTGPYRIVRSRSGERVDAARVRPPFGRSRNAGGAEVA